MHGQKKRRKRTRSGFLAVEGFKVSWELVSEPQFTSEHGYRGLRFIVRTDDGHHRELILEYPFPHKTTGNGALQIPQRPQFSIKNLETDIRRAIAAGWDPESRGKAFVFHTDT